MALQGDLPTLKVRCDQCTKYSLRGRPAKVLGRDECRDISLGIYGRWLHALQGKKVLTFQRIKYV